MSLLRYQPPSFQRWRLRVCAGPEMDGLSSPPLGHSFVNQAVFCSVLALSSSGPLHRGYSLKESTNQNETVAPCHSRREFEGAPRELTEHFFKLQQFCPSGSYFGFAHGRLSDGALSHRPRNFCQFLNENVALGLRPFYLSPMLPSNGGVVAL